MVLEREPQGLGNSGLASDQSAKSDKFPSFVKIDG